MKEVADLRESSGFAEGDGRIIRFWEDKWCRTRDETLVCGFPFPLYNDSKGAIVANIWDHSREMGGWNPRFLRSQLLGAGTSM